jgi:hypothetical protein
MMMQLLAAMGTGIGHFEIAAKHVAGAASRAFETRTS